MSGKGTIITKKNIYILHKNYHHFFNVFFIINRNICASIPSTVCRNYARLFNNEPKAIFNAMLVKFENWRILDKFHIFIIFKNKHHVIIMTRLFMRNNVNNKPYLVSVVETASRTSNVVKYARVL